MVNAKKKIDIAKAMLKLQIFVQFFHLLNAYYRNNPYRYMNMFHYLDSVKIVK